MVRALSTARGDCEEAIDNLMGSGVRFRRGLRLLVYGKAHYSCTNRNYCTSWLTRRSSARFHCGEIRPSAGSTDKGFDLQAPTIRPTPDARRPDIAIPSARHRS